jgi:Tfp pilus assembly protein PilF
MKPALLILLMISFFKEGFAQKPATTSTEKMINESLKNLDPATRKRMLDAMKTDMGRHASSDIASLPSKNDQPIIPSKSISRINALPQKILTDNELALFLKSNFSVVSGKIQASSKDLAGAVINALKLDARNSDPWATAGGGLWIVGENEAALWLMGKASMLFSADANILNTYACFLIQNGGGHLALPILQNLNSHYPGNSTILNNIGQAWFELGDMKNAEKCIDSCLRFFGNHSQGNLTKAVIEESKGNREAATTCAKRSIQQAYSPVKASMLKRLGQTLNADDIHLGQANPEAGYSLGKFMKTDLDFYYSDDDRKALLTRWAGYLEDVSEKISMNNISQQPQSNTNTSVGFNQRTSFLANKANAKVSALFDAYGDFQQRFVDQSTKMDAAFNQKTSQLAANSGAGGDKCDGVTEYKQWAFQYNQRLHQFRTSTLTRARQLIEDLVFALRYACTNDEVFQLQKQQLETEFLGYCSGVGTTPFDFQPGCINCDVLISDCMENKTPTAQPIRNGLPNFDVIHCDIHGSIPLGFGKYSWDCNVERVDIDATVGLIKGKLHYTENWVKGTFNGNSEVVVGKSVGTRAAGPLSVEAVVGGGGFVEFTDKGISDIGVITKAGVEVNGSVPGSRHEVIGLEGRVGWNSGPSVSGSGILSGK